MLGCFIGISRMQSSRTPMKCEFCMCVLLLLYKCRRLYLVYMIRFHYRDQGLP